MDESQLYILVTNSTALEGSSLTLAQNARLLGEGLSSEGKTIAEQLLNLDLKEAYKAAEKDASSHQMWSGYRIKMLASKALRSYGFDCNKVASEPALQKICQEANEARMHARSLKDNGLYAASHSIHFRVSDAELWPKGNDIMARLLMNMLQMEFGLQLMSVKDPEAYSNLLHSAVKEDIAEIFTSHAGEVLAPAAECKWRAVAQAPSPATPAAPEAAVAAAPVKNSTRILEILANHPRYTTAELAGMLGISDKGVEKHLANLKKTGALKRVGPDKGGYWRVVFIPKR